MNKVTDQIDAPPLVEEIKNNEIEVLPSEVQVPLAPEIISVGRRSSQHETDSNFPLLTKITDQIGASTAAAAPASPSRSFTEFGLGQS